jgi:hypothetical protein
MRVLFAILGGLLLLPGLCSVWVGSVMWKTGGTPFVVIGAVLIVVAILMMFAGDRRH